MSRLAWFQVCPSLLGHHQLFLAQVTKLAADEQQHPGKRNRHHAAVEAANVTKTSLLSVICKLACYRVTVCKHHTCIAWGFSGHALTVV